MKIILNQDEVLTILEKYVLDTYDVGNTAEAFLKLSGQVSPIEVVILVDKVM